MKKYILIICCLIWGQIESQAQVPGYQGKRFFIEIGGTFMPNIPLVLPFGGVQNVPWLIPSTTAQNKGPNSFPFRQNTGHYIIADRYSLGVNYVLSRKTTFKAVYNYSVSGLTTETSTASKFNSGYRDYHQLFYQLHMHDVSLKFSLTNAKKGGLAPLGFYWDLGLRFIFTKGNLRDQRVEYGSGQYPDNIPRADELNPLDIKPFTFMVGVTAQYGYRFIFADRITLNLGLQMTVFPQHAIAVSNFSPLGTSEVYTPYQRRVIYTVAGRYLLGFHIGVGALIF